MAYFFSAIAFGWSIAWSVALVGVWDQTLTCTTNFQTGVQTCDVNYGYLFLLFVSYFFTHLVLQVRSHSPRSETFADDFG